MNWYGSHLPQDFKSCASADSATPANKFVEAPPRLELGVKLLQSSALPLGYGALVIMERKTGIEPATLALARRCSTPEPLPHDIGVPQIFLGMMRVEGLEPPRSPARS